MLDLLPAQAEAVIAVLDRPESLKAWKGLLTGDYYEHHVSQERRPYDTDASPLRRALVRQGNAFLEQAREALGHNPSDDGSTPAFLMGSERWLDCADAFALSRGVRGDDEWLVRESGRRPLSGLRVGTTAFWLPGHGPAKWQSRPWGGSEDPFRSLPYLRKYDSERHGRVDRLLRVRQEKLFFAADLLEILRERLEDRDVVACGHGESFLPDFADLQKELSGFDLCLGLDSLMGMGGLLCLELAILEPLDEERPERERRMGHVLAEGRYQGAIGGYHRRRDGSLRHAPSKATMKLMFLKALGSLLDSVRSLADAGICVCGED
jgi:hypothetical protein